jgi:hypothetical protein
MNIGSSAAKWCIDGSLYGRGLNNLQRNNERFMVALDMEGRYYILSLNIMFDQGYQWRKTEVVLVLTKN